MGSTISSRRHGLTSRFKEAHVKWQLDQIEQNFDEQALGKKLSSKVDRIKSHESFYTAKSCLKQAGLDHDKELNLSFSKSISKAREESQKCDGIRFAAHDLLFNPSHSIGVRVFNSFLEQELSRLPPQNLMSHSSPSDTNSIQPLWKPGLPLLELNTSQTLNDSKHSTAVKADYSDEWRCLQEARLRKVLEDRKIRWLKQQHLPNPDKAAKALVAAAAKLKQEGNIFQTGELFPALFQSPDPMLDPIQARKDEEETLKLNFTVDMLRQLREKKKAYSKALKMSVQRIEGRTLDRYEQHQELRAIRLAYQLKQYLEELLTKNTSRVLDGVLKGVRVSIVGITRKSPTSTSKVYYEILSNHSAEFARKRIELLVPYLQYQVTKTYDLPHVPKLQFIHHQELEVKSPFAPETLAEKLSGVDLANPIEPTRGVRQFLHVDPRLCKWQYNSKKN